MPVNINDINHLFSVGEEILSGGRRTLFRITHILDDRVRIQPTESTHPSRLGYDKLSVVIDSYNQINPRQIENSVGILLNQHGMQDTQNESYLFGFAREYLSRSNSTRLENIEHDLSQELEIAKNRSKEERLARLDSANKFPDQITVTSTYFKRNADVIVEALLRANGICERCKKMRPLIGLRTARRI